MDKNFNDYKEIFLGNEIKNNKEKINSLSSNITRKKWICFGITSILLLISLPVVANATNSINTKQNLFFYSLFLASSVFLSILFLYFFFKLIFSSSQKNAVSEFRIKSLKSPKFYSYLLKAEEKKENYLSDNDFHTNRTFDIENKKSKITLLFDKNEQFVFKINDNIFTKIYHLKNVVECKLIEETSNDLTNKSTAESVILGVVDIFAVLTGDIDFCFSEPEKKIENYCNTMILSLKIKNNGTIDDIVIPFIESKITTTSNTYKTIRKKVCEIGSILDTYELQNKYGNSSVGFIFCRYCGAKNNLNDQKCSNCGALLK